MVSTLAGGAELYLERVGVLEREAYRRYEAQHQTPAIRGMLPTTQYRAEAPYRAHLWEDEYGWLRLGKALVWAGVVVLAGLCWIPGFPSPRPSPRMSSPPDDGSAGGERGRGGWLALGLMGAIGVLFVLTAARYGLVLPVAGLRAFTFLILGLLLVRCVALREQLANGLGCAAAVLLGIQAVLIGYEALAGMPIYGYLLLEPAITGRLVGTFELPNTLGVWAVLSLGFLLSVGARRSVIAIAIGATVLIVLGAGSGTGWLVLFALAAWTLVERLGRRWIMALMAVPLLALAILPAATGRWDILDSPAGRVSELRSAWNHLGTSEKIFGIAFGAGTNTAARIGDEGPLAGSLPQEVTPFSADSLPALLLLSTGAVGVAGFYGLVGWAAVRGARFRPFWIAVAICSLTIKIVELFPADLMIATALGHALAIRER